MIRTILVDDDMFIRESLSMIFGLQADIEVIGTFGNGHAAAEFVRSRLDAGESVDVVLMDIRMPVCDGVEGTKRIKTLSPRTAVLILTTFDDDEYIVEAIKHGANGYLLKNIPPDQIIEGIRTVARGHMLVHPDIARKLPGMLSASGGAKKPDGHECEPDLKRYGLTQMEINVVKLIADGLSNKEIAQSLFLSEGTVKNYITQVLSKLELRDRTQLAIFYLKHE